MALWAGGSSAFWRWESTVKWKACVHSLWKAARLTTLPVKAENIKNYWSTKQKAWQAHRCLRGLSPLVPSGRAPGGLQAARAWLCPLWGRSSSMAAGRIPESALVTRWARRWARAPLISVGWEASGAVPDLRGQPHTQAPPPPPAPPKDASGHCLCTSESSLADRWGRAFTPNQLNLQLNSYLSILLLLTRGSKPWGGLWWCPKLPVSCAEAPAAPPAFAGTWSDALTIFTALLCKDSACSSTSQCDPISWVSEMEGREKGWKEGMREGGGWGREDRKEKSRCLLAGWTHGKASLGQRRLLPWGGPGVKNIY